MKNYFKILVIVFTSLLVGGSWWATQNGWSLPRLQKSTNPSQFSNDCPSWQRDAYGNCPPRTHRLSLGSREFGDNRGK
jgi:hypothetical protein